MNPAMWMSLPPYLQLSVGLLGVISEIRLEAGIPAQVFLDRSVVQQAQRRQWGQGTGVGRSLAVSRWPEWPTGLHPPKTCKNKGKSHRGVLPKKPGTWVYLHQLPIAIISWEWSWKYWFSALLACTEQHWLGTLDARDNPQADRHRWVQEDGSTLTAHTSADLHCEDRRWQWERSSQCCSLHRGEHAIHDD